MQASHRLACAHSASGGREAELRALQLPAPPCFQSVNQISKGVLVIIDTGTEQLCDRNLKEKQQEEKIANFRITSLKSPALQCAVYCALAWVGGGVPA
ncbi:hypothetical protein NDU88_003706 [Pleurodeles waltl]|uniref:Uncharacterized protein n=1 Tax=Pleurodeles waltl TaxID=8319 RepID=A0AAV7QG74_PLEWA|nr:hypothetical protein NDU88_003706 [Pleurodeles waltl]